MSLNALVVCEPVAYGTNPARVLEIGAHSLNFSTQAVEVGLKLRHRRLKQARPSHGPEDLKSALLLGHSRVEVENLDSSDLSC